MLNTTWPWLKKQLNTLKTLGSCLFNRQKIKSILKMIWSWLKGKLVAFKTWLKCQKIHVAINVRFVVLAVFATLILLCLFCWASLHCASPVFLKGETLIHQCWAWCVAKPHRAFIILTVFFGLIILIGTKGWSMLCKQQIHQSHSIVQFFFLVLALFTSSLFLLRLIGPEHYPWIIFSILTTFALTTLYFWIRNPSRKLQFQFAASSIGRNSDRYNHSESAKNWAVGMRDSTQYVSVYGLYGGLGQGKSSFARMIVEWLLDPTILGVRKTLYTYLSLTETNEAKDLSKLFAERWEETLSDRYPRIETRSLYVLKSIFREGSEGVIASLLDLLQQFNIGLLPMVSKLRDGGVDKNHAQITRNMRTLFGEIPHINEDLWVIMIDEIERATLDEIYRLIEIVERFKTEGRTGLPTKIVFLLCIARDELEVYLRRFQRQDPHAYLIQDFFIRNPKNITNTINLPPTARIEKEQYLINRIQQLASSYNIEKISNNLVPSDMAISRRGSSSHKDFDTRAIEFLIAHIARRDLRTISRFLEEVESFYRSFRFIDMSSPQNYFQPCDILGLSYIRAAFPYLIEFFRKTVNQLTRRDNFGGDEADDYLEHKNDNGSPAELLAAWISRVAGTNIKDKKEQHIVNDLVCIVAHAWLDRLAGSYEPTRFLYDYEGSTSDPRYMDVYLRMIPNRAEEGDVIQWVLNTYRRHIGSTKDASALKEESSLEYVLEYARIVRAFDSITKNPHVLKDVIEILGEWIIQKGKVPLQLYSVGTTPLMTLLYEFSIYVKKYSKYLLSIPNADFKWVFAQINTMLGSPNVPLRVKYHLMGSFAFTSRDGANGRIDYETLAIFKSLMERDVDDSIRQHMKGVFDERNDHYGDENWIIYEHEENPFFVIYQGWSGDASDSDEIARIRRVVRRGLENNQKAIEYHWRRFPSADEFRDQYPEQSRSHLMNAELYLPLNELIELTKKMKDEMDEIIVEKMKKWDSLLSDKTEQQRYQELAGLKPDNNTLYTAFLRSQNLS